jgi:hypothetical protein
LLFIAAIVGIAASFRLIPHPGNFSPIGAIALFGGASFSTKRGALFIPLAAMLLSDIVLGFHVLMPVVYGCLGLNMLLGRWIRSRRRIATIVLATIVGATQFFVITNFACWVVAYPHTLEGLSACYVAAIPYFRNTLIGDAVFTTTLFSMLALAEAAAPVLREQRGFAKESLAI